MYTFTFVILPYIWWEPGVGGFMGDLQMGHWVMRSSSAHRMHDQCFVPQGRAIVGGTSMHTGDSCVPPVKAGACLKGVARGD